jgi:dihydrofolate synthase/folylpolyglutamate synthase
VETLAHHFDRFIVTQYQENPRAVPADSLAKTLTDVLGSRAAEVSVCAIPSQAWQYVRQTAMPGELICIAGSFYLAAEMRRLVIAQ